MIGFIGTSLQLHPIIRAHTLNFFLTTSAQRIFYCCLNLGFVSPLTHSESLLLLELSPSLSYDRWSCGICGGQSGAGAGFLRVLRFPLPIFIPPIALQSSSSIIWGLYNRPGVAAVPRDLVPPHQ
jgi:hypothetical protein